MHARSNFLGLALCRPDGADQTYSTAHLAQAQGKFCSMRHLAEPLHVDVSGRWVHALLWRPKEILYWQHLAGPVSMPFNPKRYSWICHG